MKTPEKIEDDLRERIIEQPDVILNDHDLMRALVAANERSMGGNVVDLRGIAMERLEARLDRLEDTNRSVIAAAYENLAGMNQVHRAVLRMLDPMDFETFLRDLGGEVAEILGVDFAHLVLETQQEDEDPTVRRLGQVLRVVPPGFVTAYVERDRSAPARQIVLRQVSRGIAEVYGQNAEWVRSEACLRLDFGPGRMPGMLVLGSEDPHLFSPQQGTDLLSFFAGTFERTMRRWLQ
ncbi:DUF484 family protein [Pseudooceanicola sp.]|uniref:DUF484 family protein n=1 Tax=Pseudooceanicola sp. TaxID=1914328 RepID=UPI004058170C